MRNKILFPIFFLFLIGFLVYAFNLNNPLFWDDDEWIIGNTFVHSFSYLKEIFTQNVLAGFGLNSNYFRPLLLLSFAFNYVIHGVNPFGYHLFSNLIHIVNGILVFLLLVRFLNPRISFIAALLFLIHPVQTEAVAYISGRGDPLSVFFMLLAFYVFVCREKRGNYKNVTPLHLDNYQTNKEKSEPIGESSDKLKEASNRFESKWGRGGHIFLSLLFFILAILSRETAILFPLLLMIFYISFLSKDRFLPALKKSFIAATPFWVISITYFILRLTVFNFENTLNFYSQANIYSENLSYRLYTFSAVLIEYFKIIFFPVGLHMERDFPIFTSLFQWPVWLATVLIIVIILLFFFLQRRSTFNGQHPKIWFFSWAWFFVALGPVSGIIPINALIYEHWLYLPLIGFATLIGFYIDKFLTFLKSRKFAVGYSLFAIGLIIYFSFFAFQSIRRNILWGKPIEFYENILKYSPSSVRILTNLGKLYSEKGESTKAIEFYQRAINTPDGRFFAEPYYNLGNIYRDSNQIDKAIEYYQKAVEVNPQFPFAYQNLAEMYVNRKQDLVSGIEVLEKLKEIQPGNSRVYYNLGLLYLTTDNVSLAIENFEIGLRVAPGLDPEIEQAISEILNQIR